LDRQSPPKERFGLAIAVLLAVKLGEVVEADGKVGVVGADCRFWFRLSFPADAPLAIAFCQIRQLNQSIPARQLWRKTR
jgi:hypothetical protein